MKIHTATIGVINLLLTATAWSQVPTPIGDQFQVNAYTANTQALPVVAADSQSNFVVVWNGYGSPDIGGYNIHARQFDAIRAPLGDQFQVNTYTTSFQSDPKVAIAPLGGLIVVWGSLFSANESNRSVQAQLFDSSGTAVGNQFQLNSYTTGVQEAASLAVDSQGNFIVVWHSGGSTGSDSDEKSIQARLYDANGAAIGNEFQVNSYTTYDQVNPSIGLDADGDFVVVWQSYGSSLSDTSGYSIQAQRFLANGMPNGGQFEVNTSTPNDQSYPSVAMSAGGEFVVAWQSDGTAGGDTSGYGIRARRFSATGATVGAEFQVNTYSTDDQLYPSVVADSGGDFVVVWTSYGSDGTDSSATSIQGQSFSAAGSPLGGEFQVNTYTSSYQASPAVAFRPAGDFVVVWDSKGSDGTDQGGLADKSIQAQLLSLQIFSDGFESGNDSAWSTTIP